MARSRSAPARLDPDPEREPELAVDEIERRADDRRFVQVLMWAMNELPLGRRFYWPIYRAAEKHALPIGVHAGSLYRHAPSSDRLGFLSD